MPAPPARKEPRRARSPRQQAFGWYRSRQTVAHEKFLNRAMGLVDRLVGEGRSASVGIGDRHLAEALPADDVRTLLGRYVRIGECVIGIGIAPRPAVYGDGQYIVRRAEASRAQHAVKLAANFKFEVAEGHGQQFALARSVLLFAWQARLVRIAHHVQQDRLVGRGDAAVSA